MNAALIPSREECVVTLDRSSAPRVVHYGEGFLRERAWPAPIWYLPRAAESAR